MQLLPQHSIKKLTLFSLNKNGMVAEMLLLLVVFAGVAGGAYWLMNKDDNETSDEQEVTVTLPSDAVQISTCIPGEGEHWVSLKNIPQGPYYVANGTEVVAMEYMFLQDDIPGKEFANLQPAEIPGYMETNELSMADIHKDLGSLEMNMMNIPFEHANIHWTPPHAGMPVPHIDIHFYLKDHAYLQTICPDADINDNYAPEFIEKLQEYNIPLPGGDTTSGS